MIVIPIPMLIALAIYIGGMWATAFYVGLAGYSSDWPCIIWSSVLWPLFWILLLWLQILDLFHYIESRPDSNLAKRTLLGCSALCSSTFSCLLTLLFWLTLLFRPFSLGRLIRNSFRNHKKNNQTPRMSLIL